MKLTKSVEAAFTFAESHLSKGAIDRVYNEIVSDGIVTAAEECAVDRFVEEYKVSRELSAPLTSLPGLPRTRTFDRFMAANGYRCSQMFPSRTNGECNNYVKEGSLVWGSDWKSKYRAEATAPTASVRVHPEEAKAARNWLLQRASASKDIEKEAKALMALPDTPERGSRYDALHAKGKAWGIETSQYGDIY